MTTTETRRYEMLVRVSAFGESHGELFPKTGLGGQAFVAVADAVKDLHEHAVSKMMTAKGGRKAKAMARAALIEQLETTVRSARGIAAVTPGFDDRFQMPRARTDAAFLTAGRAFIEEAQRVKEQFTRYDMPADFVARLTGCVDEFEQAIRAQQVGRDGLAKARASIERAFASGLAAVQTLDIVVPNRLHDDPVTLSVWEQDRRIDYSRRTRRVTAAPPEAMPSNTPGDQPSVPEAPATPLEKAS